MFAHLNAAFERVDSEYLRGFLAMRGDEVPPEDVLGLLLGFHLEGEDLLFLLVHGPHDLEREAHGGDSVHGLEEVAIHAVLVLRVHGEMRRRDAVVVPSFVADLKQLPFRCVSDWSERLELSRAHAHVVRLEIQLVSCDLAGDAVAVVHLVALQLLHLLDGVHRRQTREVHFAGHELLLFQDSLNNHQTLLLENHGTVGQEESVVLLESLLVCFVVVLLLLIVFFLFVRFLSQEKRW